PIVLETINPACWLAFFSSYIRDFTHVRPVHPETLQYLLRANGFERVTIRYSAPVPEHMKMKTIDLPADVLTAADAGSKALAQLGHSVVVLERHPRPGQDTSTHNSGVIHAGLYHPPGSLKSRLCVEGRRLLYDFCAMHGVPHVHSGKLVVAHDDSEIQQLEMLKRRATENGVEGLEIVGRAFIAAREPAVNATAALWSPESGIVNAEELVKALLRVGADAGAIFLPATKLLGADKSAGGMVLTTDPESI